MKDKTRIIGFALIIFGIFVLWLIGREITIVAENKPEFYKTTLVPVYVATFAICTGIFMLSIGRRFYSVFRVNSNVSILQIVFIASIIGCLYLISEWRIGSFTAIGYEKFWWPK